jgi:hypothetical protein
MDHVFNFVYNRNEKEHQNTRQFDLYSDDTYTIYCTFIKVNQTHKYLKLNIKYRN